MACNSCTKPFSLLRKEKGCPGCGFSYCSKCLAHTVFLTKLNSEAKVCTKCKNNQTDKNNSTSDAVIKYSINKECTLNTETDKTIGIDLEIAKRLANLKSNLEKTKNEKDITERLQKLKGQDVKISDAELYDRLAKLKESEPSTTQCKPLSLIQIESKNAQEQVDDLMKQYLEETGIEDKHKKIFDEEMKNVETRLQNLKGTDKPADTNLNNDIENEDEEETVKKIIEKYKAEAALDQDDVELRQTSNDELPFCEICNEDATLRCLGCQYIFCKRCFMDHQDDECNRYVPYQPKIKQ